MNDVDYYKQVIAIRKDLNLSRGKEIAQGAHAAMSAAGWADATDRAKWKQTGQTKIVVGIEGHDAATELYEQAVEAGVPSALIKDEGRTELEPGTVTAVGIGPDIAENVDEHTGELNLL